MRLCAQEMNGMRGTAIAVLLPIGKADERGSGASAQIAGPWTSAASGRSALLKMLAVTAALAVLRAWQPARPRSALVQLDLCRGSRTARGWPECGGQPTSPQLRRLHEHAAATAARLVRCNCTAALPMRRADPPPAGRHSREQNGYASRGVNQKISVHRGTPSPLRPSGNHQAIAVHLRSLAADSTTFSMKRTPRAPSSTRG